MKNISLMFLLSALLLSCSNEPKQQEKSTAKEDSNTIELSNEQLKNAGITTVKAQRRNIASILKVNGVIDVPPQNMVSISVPLGGYLKSTQLLPGMHVKKGETIAIMEDQQYIQLQQDFLTTKARMVYSESEYERQKELNQSKASSDKVFQQAQAEYTSQKVMLRSLSEKLKLIGIDPDKLDETNLSRSVRIVSPIDGFVSKVNVNIGKYANPSDVLFEIVNPADIHLALTIFEKDINKLYIGQKLLAYTNANPEKKYPCSIILIGKDFSTDRSVQVHCHFENYDQTLIPGMFMTAEIEIENNEAYTLPSDAIVRYGNKQYVFVAKGSTRFEMLEVKTGNTENGFTEIYLGNTNLPNLSFVTTGAYTLLMKMKNTTE